MRSLVLVTFKDNVNVVLGLIYFFLCQEPIKFDGLLPLFKNYYFYTLPYPKTKECQIETKEKIEPRHSKQTIISWNLLFKSWWNLVEMLFITHFIHWKHHKMNCEQLRKQASFSWKVFSSKFQKLFVTLFTNLVKLYLKKWGLLLVHCVKINLKNLTTGFCKPNKFKI